MSKISLEDVVDYLEDYHQYTNYGMCRCLWHSPDDNPSLRIGDWGYKCLSCGEHGSLLKLYEHVSGRFVVKEKRPFNPSALIWDKWKDRFGSIQSIAKLAHNNLLQNPDLGHYLKVRKVDSQIKTGMMGYLDGYYTMPVKNEYEEVEGIVARASPTIQTKQIRYTVSKNCPVKLYIPSWREVLKANELYCCYGTLDAWTLKICGYAGFTGISGQEMNPVNMERFRKRIFLIPDRGEEKNAMELQRRMDWRMVVLFLDYPPDCKDLNDIYMKFGIEKVQELITEQRRKFDYE